MEEEPLISPSISPTNTYGTLHSKSSGNLENNIVNNAFYNNRPYKQNEFDEVCKRQPIQKPGFFENCIRSVRRTQCCQPFGFLMSLFPILTWLPNYNWKQDFGCDIISGITIAVVHIPQGMAYSTLAAVPPIVGIYMAFFPVLVYMLMGTSRHLSMGTFSVICMMTSKAVVMYSDPMYLSASDQPKFDWNSTNTNDTMTLISAAQIVRTGLTPVQVASAVCMIVGIWHVILGTLKLGYLSVLMSEAMISGFTTGTAILVLSSQIKHVLGIALPRQQGLLRVVHTVEGIIGSIGETNILAMEIAIGVTLALFIYNEWCKAALKKIISIPLPVELIVVVLGTLASTKFQFQEKHNITTVGNIPTGFPTILAPPLWLLPNLILDGLVIAIIAFSINISMASILSKNEYKVDSNQELIASGFSNIFASFFSCAPFCSSLSRSVIQMETGGKTQLASGISCACLVFVLLFIGPFFEPLPHCVLTGMVLTAMKGMLMQTRDFFKFWKQSRADGIVWAATFLSVVLLDIDYGLIIGIIMSLICVIWSGQKVLIFKLGRIFTTDIYVESARYQSALEVPGLLILRIIGSINFVNKDKIISKILSYQREHKACPIRIVIIDMMAISSVDSGVVRAFSNLNNELKSQDIVLNLVHFTDPVKKLFERCQFFDSFPENRLFPTIHDAVLYSELDGSRNNNYSCSNLTDITSVESNLDLHGLNFNISSKL